MTNKQSVEQVAYIETTKKLADYMVKRDRERYEAAVKAFSSLSDREQVLVKEAAVAAWVVSKLYGSEVPRDDVILAMVYDCVLSNADLYPTLAGVYLEANEGESR